MYRVIKKETGIFIRDDFSVDEAIEIGLSVEPAQGLYSPKWDFVNEVWVEGGTPPDPVAPETTLEERLTKVETDTDEIVSVLAEIVGLSV